MTVLRAICDLIDGWTFDDNFDKNLIIGFKSGEKNRFKVEALQFGFKVLVNDALIDSFDFPEENVIIRELTPEREFFFRLPVFPDDLVTLKFWAINNETRFENFISWIVDRPVKPYESWLWINKKWSPPVDYPRDGLEYAWNEETGDWVEAGA